MKHLILVSCLFILLIPGAASAQNQDDFHVFDNGILSFHYPSTWDLQTQSYAGAVGAYNLPDAFSRLQDAADGTRGIPNSGDQAVALLAFPSAYITTVDATLDLSDGLALASGLKFAFLAADYAPEDFEISEPVAVTLGAVEYWEVEASMPGRDELTLFRVENNVVVAVFGIAAQGELEALRQTTYDAAESAAISVPDQVLYGILRGEVTAALFIPRQNAVTPDELVNPPDLGPMQMMQVFNNGLLTFRYGEDWPLEVDEDFPGAVLLANTEAAMQRASAEGDDPRFAALPGEQFVAVAAYPSEVLSLVLNGEAPSDDLVTFAHDFVLVSELTNYAEAEIQIGEPVVLSFGDFVAVEVPVLVPSQEELYIIRRLDNGTVLFTFGATAPGEIDALRPMLYAMMRSARSRLPDSTLMAILRGEADAAEFAPIQPAPLDAESIAALESGEFMEFFNGVVSLNYPADWVIAGDFAGVANMANSQAVLDRMEEEFIGQLATFEAGDQMVSVRTVTPEFITLTEMSIDYDDPLSLATSMATLFQGVNFPDGDYSLGEPELVELVGLTYAEVLASNATRDELYLVRFTEHELIQVVSGAAASGEMDALRPTLYAVAGATRVHMTRDEMNSINVGDIDGNDFNPNFVPEPLRDPAYITNAEAVWQAVFSGDRAGANENLCERAQYSQERIDELAAAYTMHAGVCEHRDDLQEDLIICDLVLETENGVQDSSQRFIVDGDGLCTVER